MQRLRAAWILPTALFVATFGVFSVRHPGSVKAMLSSTRGVGTTAGAVAAIVIFLLAARLRPVIRRVAPFVLSLGVLGAAAYAEVPFDRTSTQNRTLVQSRTLAARLSTGRLQGINHSASGDVSIIESRAGTRVVRFEHFSVQGAPAPVLYVIEGEDERAPAGINLGAFSATAGTTLDVALPSGVAPGPGWTVLIWCEKFATPIANATQH